MAISLADDLIERIRQRRDDGKRKYGVELTDQSLVDFGREKRAELIDYLLYDLGDFYRWQELRHILLEWHASGHDLPARALELLSRQTSAEEIESNHANSKHS